MIDGGVIGGFAVGDAVRSRAPRFVYSVYAPAGTGSLHMNFGTLVTEAQRLAGRVDSTIDDRTKKWLNQSLEEYFRSAPGGLLEEEDVFTADGNQFLYLPRHVRKINWIVSETNKNPVDRSERWDRRYTAGMVDRTKGGSYRWRELGWSPVAGQPTQASEIYFDPESAETVVCYVQGYVQDTTVSGSAALYEHLAEEFVTCVTGVEAATVRKWTKVITLGKAATSTGDVVAAYTSGGTTVARVLAPDFMARYRRVQIYYEPSAGNQFRVNYQVYPFDLHNDNQILPPGVDRDYLVYRTAAKIHQAMGEVEEAAVKLNVARSILQDVAQEEETHGDQDFEQSIPSYEYWHDPED